MKRATMTNVDSDLSKSGMLPFLPDSCKLQLHKKVESTNTLAKELADSGAAHGLVIIAEEQWAGRGRQGRSFYSPPGHGIYMSLVLKPEKLGFNTAAFITVYTAVVVCEAIEFLCGKSPQIKWINDLFLKGKKFCGILAEAVSDIETGAINRIVVGIGINFTLSKLPKELEAIVGAIYDEGSAPVSRNRLAAEIISRMLASPRSQEEILEQYRRRLFILGKEVLIESAGQAYEAIALDVNEMGHLLIKNMSGELESLSSGEVSVRLRSKD